MTENLHYIQMQILKDLVYKQSLEFKDFKYKNITSDLLSYHLKVLQQLGLIDKDKNKYCLSNLGKSYTANIDKEKLEIEKTGRPICLIILENTKLENKILIQKRTKSPMFGVYGFIAGKIKFGETIVEGGKRELLEETGLDAELEHRFCLHELSVDKENNVIGDLYLQVLYGNKFTGKLRNTKEGENIWVSYEEFYKIEPKFNTEIEIYDLCKSGFRGVKEGRYLGEGF